MSSTSITDMFGMVTPKATVPSASSLAMVNGRDGLVIPHETLIGIEMEIENAHIVHQFDRIWTNEGDGSLRNNGMEFKTRPMPASMAPAALASLFHGLGDDACYSARTSCHVHVNMSDLDSDVVRNFVLMYMWMEPMFYRFVGRQRIKNIYCVPVTETNLVKGLLTDRFDKVVKKWSKYCGLNLLPLAQFGTVEFRHMAGTEDIMKLCVWIRLITTLLAYAKANSISGLRDRVSKLDYERAEQFLKEVFGEDARYMKMSGDVQRSLDNMRLAYTAVKSPLGEVLESPFFTFKKAS